MSDFTCPRCATRLDDLRVDGLRGWHCHTCDGHAVNLAQLRSRMAEKGFKKMWLTARAAPDGGPGCPVCRRSMRVIMTGEHPIEIDVCVGCQMLWLDAGELVKLGVAPSQRAGTTVDQVAARQAAEVLLAEARVKGEGYRLRSERNIRRGGGVLVTLLDALAWWSL